MLASIFYRLGLLKVADSDYGRPGNVIVSFSKENCSSKRYSTVRVTLFGRVPSISTVEYTLARWGEENHYKLHTFSIHGKTFGFKNNLIKE